MSSLASQFLTTCRLFGERPALWADGELATYDELAKGAKAIAAALTHGARGQGASRTGEPGGTPNCAVFAHRSRIAYEGIAGALLARHAYVALSPKQPLHRLENILAQSDAGAMVIDARCLDMARTLLDGRPRGMTVILPGEAVAPPWTASCPQHDFVMKGDLERAGAGQETSGNESDTAYIMFTSGSTGEPKGVVVSHGNVLAYTNAMIDRYSYRPEDRLIHLPELTFDLSVHDLFAAWASGASLFCVPERDVMLPDQFVRRHQLTGWTSVPSAASFLKQFNKLKPDSLESLRVSVFCGEPFPGPLAADWCRAASRSVVDNLYGPTEATVAFTGYSTKSGTDHAVLPLGLPFPGLDAAVCNENLKELPEGEIGELLLGGAQVAQGYWRDHEMTARQFVELRLPGKQARRWYKTGDLAVYDFRCGYVYKGRLTRQVKIRGYRVELPEIEAVIRRMLDAPFTAVVPKMNETGTADYVVAFVETDRPFDEAELLAGCELDLPGYMIPKRVFRLDKMPLTENGKTDYKALESALGKMIT